MDCKSSITINSDDHNMYASKQTNSDPNNNNNNHNNNNSG